VVLAKFIYRELCDIPKKFKKNYCKEPRKFALRRLKKLLVEKTQEITG
jgi:hypothetical protein